MDFNRLNGALLIDKHAGVSSFGIIEELQRHLLRLDSSVQSGLRKRDLPSMGHGGTLDPFATGLLLVCVGRAVKLARYFLGSGKSYEGIIRFGETTVSGDPTNEIIERSDKIPASIEEIRAFALRFTEEPYSQTPPMHSAKKKDGKPLYELARQGIEVEREARVCKLHSFEILTYENSRSAFHVSCSSGTYIRTLAQDLGRKLGTVAMLDTLHRTRSGVFDNSNAWSVEKISEAMKQGKSWDELPCWKPFHQLLGGYDRADATPAEAEALTQGKQNVLIGILKRAKPPTGTHVVIYCKDSIVAVACRNNQGSTEPYQDIHVGSWGLERVFID